MQSTMPTPLPRSAPIGAAPTALMLACLAGLVFLNIVQIAAGLSSVDIKPPENVLPLIAATAGLGIAAAVLVRSGERLGYYAGIAFCVLSMIGAGPHKIFLENGVQIAPMALLGFVAEVAFIVYAVREMRRPS